MNCTSLRAKLQPALEGEKLSSEARAHLKSCAACDREWLALQQAAVGVAALETRRLGPGFDARVLAAVASARRESPAPWARLAMNAAVTGLALWAAALAQRAPSLSWLELLRLALHPERVLQAGGVRTAEALLALADFAKGARVLARGAEPLYPGLLVHAAASAAIAALVLAALDRQRRKSWKPSPSR